MITEGAVIYFPIIIHDYVSHTVSHIISHTVTLLVRTIERNKINYIYFIFAYIFLVYPLA